MLRTEFLRQEMINAAHKGARKILPKDWSVSDWNISLPERRAQALKQLFEKMPLYIGEQELIVGSRTIYGHRNEAQDWSDIDLIAFPDFVNEQDISEWGGDDSQLTAGHYTADYGKILALGIAGIKKEVETRLSQELRQDQRDYLNSIFIAYQGLSAWILRYADYAEDLSKRETERKRRGELEIISKVCRKISCQKPENFYEAAQLFWFSHLSLIIESFRFMSYGRLDQVLFPFFSLADVEFEQQITDCLVIKMYDGGDVIHNYTGAYSGQHTMTLGGITPEGEDAVNEVTRLLLDAIGRIALPEPMVQIRWHRKNPAWFLRKAAEISVSGVNTIAYYHDELYIQNLKEAGWKEQEANDYAFDLCQDVTLAGRAGLFCSASINLTSVLVATLKQVPDSITFQELIEEIRKNLADEIRLRISEYNRWEQGILDLNEGRKAAFTKRVKSGEIPISFHKNSPMAPLPLASALFEGCIETATDLARRGLAVKDKGAMICGVVEAINSLAAVRKIALEEKIFTISQIMKACDENFENNEVMRQRLWNAPKWGNDDDFADLPAKELLEFGCREILKYRTPMGGRHLAGIHQPHPVNDGWNTPATPEGRKAREPIAVTLSPENGTMQNGPTAALASACKISPEVYQWNNCLMLQFLSSAFPAKGGAESFCQLLRTYFMHGGAQFQPNIVNLAYIKDAQIHPENYQNLIVRLWGVSVRFITLPKEVQDEFISRFE